MRHGDRAFLIFENSNFGDVGFLEGIVHYRRLVLYSLQGLPGPDLNRSYATPLEQPTLSLPRNHTILLSPGKRLKVWTPQNNKRNGGKKKVFFSMAYCIRGGKTDR